LIGFPDWGSLKPGFAGSQYIIDCTSHFHRRVHPGQALYYRGDKHAHFLTAEVVTSSEGFPYHVTIGLVHINDKGMFNLGIRSYVEKNNLVGLSDRGYQHPLLIQPDNVAMATRLNNETLEQFSYVHSAYRSPGEVINSLTKNWAFASTLCSQMPEFQAVSLMLIYNLVSMVMMECPTWFLNCAKI